MKLLCFECKSVKKGFFLSGRLDLLVVSLQNDEEANQEKKSCKETERRQ